MQSTNVHGFGSDNDIKTEQMIKTIEEMSIEMMMINEKNASGTLELLKNYETS